MKVILALALAAFATTLSAQTPDSSAKSPTEDSSSTEQPHPAFAVGISGGAASFRNGSSSQATTGILEYSPASWLTLSASPSYARATDSTGNFVTYGLTDLPLAAGVSHTFQGAWSLELGLSLGVTIPEGDTATGFGNGAVGLGGSLGLSLSPAESFHVSLGAGRGVLNRAAGSTFAAGSATSVSVEASADIGDRTTFGLSYGEDVGSSAAEPLERVAGGGVSYSLAGPLTLALDATHGFGAESAKWVVSLGIGTAFAGISPVSATTPLRRLRGLSGGNGIGSSKKAKPGAAGAGRSCRARSCK